MKYAMMEKKMYKPVMGSLPFCDMLRKGCFKHIYSEEFRLLNAVRVSCQK